MTTSSPRSSPSSTAPTPCSTTRRSFSRADVAFHRAIVEATDNALFLVLIDSLADVLLQLRRATLVDHDRAGRAVAEHRRIADALARRDVEGAVAAMRDHLADSLDAFRHAIED